jgi:hypothetical protein
MEPVRIDDRDAVVPPVGIRGLHGLGAEAVARRRDRLVAAEIEDEQRFRMRRRPAV